jgi:erythromycin esterase
MVGDASLVALGEATHGTREFFRMKHRLLKWLVREKGFSYFGIEATFPEALDVDRYVQTGDGDPAILLARLYFWTWNTQEVLDMITWMRAWNAAGNQPKVHFVGFDMQFPGTALDSVETFVKRVDATAGADVHTAYDCLNQFRTYPTTTGSAGLERYVQQTPDFKTACRSSLQYVDSLVARREAQWASLEGADKMRLVRRYARLVSQWEAMTTSSSGSFTRDQAMAENVMWWHDTQAPGAKMVLWAHNMHVSRIRSWMGDHLTRKYGGEYLIIGQTFGSGSFNAVLGAPRAATDTGPGLRPQSVYGVRDESIEAVFQQVGLPRLILDARALRTSTEAGTAPLSLPMSIRTIGALFDPRIAATGYQSALLLKNDYDLLVWFQNGTASVLLPFPSDTARVAFRRR